MSSTPTPSAADDSQDAPDGRHRAPDNISDATIEALGKLSEALETTERARGHLYGFHQLTGKADFELGDAAELLRAAGHGELSEELRTQLVGRNVLQGRWTFQIVEDYDDNYWNAMREFEKRVREELVGGRRHLFEARLKEARRTHGHKDHTARPQ